LERSGWSVVGRGLAPARSRPTTSSNKLVKLLHLLVELFELNVTCVLMPQKSRNAEDGIIKTRGGPKTWWEENSSQRILIMIGINS